MKIDETDVYILRALLSDGRSTYRDIARSLAISTPTVEARIRKMKDAGLIKRFVPLIDADKLSENITAIVMARADLRNVDSISEDLSKLEPIREAYFTTGEHNLVMKLSVYDVNELQDFTQQELSKIEGVELSSTYVVTRALKEEQRARLRPGMRLRLRCEKCNQEIKGTPITVKIGERVRYFCCKVCAGTYEDKRS